MYVMYIMYLNVTFIKRNINRYFIDTFALLYTTVIYYSCLYYYIHEYRKDD